MENNYGAKKGLAEKMAYWKDKDYQYMYGVTLGQAFNLAFESKDDRDSIPTRESVLKIFTMLLKAKLDDEFIDIFNEYFDKKVTLDRGEKIKTVVLD